MCATVFLCSEREIREVVARAVGDCAVRAELSEERVFTIKLVLEELLANCFEHAGARETRLRYDFCDKCLCASIYDGGLGFDWESKTDLPAPERESGRGIFLARELADELVYNECGNEVFARISLT